MKNNIKPHRSNRVKRKKNPAGGLTEEGRRYFRKRRELIFSLE